MQLGGIVLIELLCDTLKEDNRNCMGGETEKFPHPDSEVVIAQSVWKAPYSPPAPPLPWAAFTAQAAQGPSMGTSKDGAPAAQGSAGISVPSE